MEQWIAYALISMFFAGLTSVIAKFGMNHVSSDAALAVRTTVVFSLVILNAFLLKNSFSELKQISSKDFFVLGLSGLTTSLSWIFYYRAMKDGQVAYVASIDKASIVVTLLLSFTLLKEPISVKVILGASFILVGMLILIWK